MPAEFDVFLSHSSQDKPVVEEIGEWLRSRGLRVWLDKWELRPGFPWQEGLEEGVRSSRAVAVFVGEGGLGAWQEPEMRAFIARSRREQVPVIPVLLPECPDSPQLSLFLEAFTWVDLRPGRTADSLARLVWGITGEKPREIEEDTAPRARSASRAQPARARGNWRPWATGISLLVVTLALATWLWARGPSPPQRVKPALYAVRVQVLDPQGHPVAAAKVRASAGNEPHLLPDGWWEVQIPDAKVPSDKRVTFWAEHEDWEGNRGDLRLGDDPNPRVEVHLKEPETWLRGQVVDGSDRVVPGARVVPQEGLPGMSFTDAEGRFALKLAVPREARIRLRAEPPSGPPGDAFCYAGRDSCSIVLEKKQAAPL